MTEVALERAGEDSVRGRLDVVLHALELEGLRLAVELHASEDRQGLVRLIRASSAGMGPGLILTRSTPDPRFVLRASAAKVNLDPDLSAYFHSRSTAPASTFA